MLPLSTWHSGLQQNLDYIKYRLDLHPDTMNIAFITDIHTKCEYGVRFNAYCKGKPIDDKDTSQNRGGSASYPWYTNGNKVNRLDRACVALKKLSEQKKIDLIVLGGDYLSNTNYTTRDSGLKGFYESNSCIKKLRDIAPILICKGNHDSNTIITVDRYITNEEYSEFIYKDIPKASNVVYDDNGNYGYYDDKKRKVRIIWLNTTEVPPLDGTQNSPRNPQYAWYFQQTQLEFLIQALTIKESGWRVITFHHHNWINDQSNADNSGNSYRYALKEIIASFRHKLSGSYVRNSTYDQFDLNISWDFTENGDNYFLCGINGHGHGDGVSGGVYKISNGTFYAEEDSATLNSERYILQSIGCAALCTNNSWGYSGNGDITSVSSISGDVPTNDSNNTVYESSFDIISIDVNNDIIYKNRFGNGLSWQYKYDNNINSKNTGSVTKQYKSIDVTIENTEIQDATVTIRYNGCDITLNTTNGIAKFKEMPYDKCIIKATAEGYQDYVEPIDNINLTNKSITLTRNE